MDSPAATADSVRPTRVAELVSRAAERTPDQPAVIDVTSGNALTWAELDAAVSGEAQRLAAAGVGTGDRVVVRLTGGAGFCVAVLGALRAGAIAVPYGPPAVRRELDVVFSDCRPRVVIAAESDQAAAGSAELVDAAVLAPPSLTGRPSAPTGTPSAVGGDPEDVALLVYTSSTTGSPRGVCLSHRAVLANRAQAAGLRPSPVTPVDRVLLTLPLFHVVGLAAGFLQTCWAGATSVLVEDPTPESVAAALVEHRASALWGVPSMFRSLLDLPADRLREATSGVRVCTSGGAPLPGDWLKAFHEATGLWIVEGYGLTEAGPVATSNPYDRPPKAGSVGRVLPGVELRLVDVDGRPLTERAEVEPDSADEWDDWDDLDAGDPADDTGMVALRGPNLFSGYWPDRSGGPDAEGWFRTADVGFLDADGDLRLVDRSSDVVIVNGFNVFPREVEQVVSEIEGVAEAAVVGVPDERTGEAVKAVVVLAPDVELSEQEVLAHCAARLARFKVPADVVFVDALPRTPTGKVARKQLAGGGA